MDKYKKSDFCLLCNTPVTNHKRDGLFMCDNCTTALENEIKELLTKRSTFANKIVNVNAVTVSAFGASNKTLCITVSMAQWSNVYVQIPTSKILEIRDLGDVDLLFEYIEAEIKVQYALAWDKYIVPVINTFVPLS
jgi:hypothetical protein